jgi:hypothetical protein
MTWEIDHVFLAIADPTLEEVAGDFGLQFTRRSVHQGQGTANACAVFENAFLELLFPVQADEITSDLVRPLGLDERTRWRETGACPFGICFRPRAPLADERALPFETWPYHAAYLPAGASLPIVTPQGSLFEPLLFVTTEPRPPGIFQGGVHRGAKRRLTTLSVQSPHAVSSPAIRWFLDNDLLSFRRGAEYLVELTLDGGQSGTSARLPAPLPIEVRW